MTKNKSPFLAGLLLVAALSAGIYSWDLQTRSIWLDEDLEMTVSLAKYDLVVHAMTMGQPPLHYLMQSAVYQSFGVTVATARGPSLVFGVLGVTALFLFLYELTIPMGIVLAISLFYALNPWVIWFSQEARPYMMGNLSAIFLVGFLGLSFFERDFRRWSLEIAASLLLFFLTIGFQPVSLVLSLAIAALVCERKKIRAGISFLVLPAAYGVMLFLPVLYGVIRESSKHHYVKTIRPDFARWAEGTRSVLENIPRILGFEQTWRWILVGILMILGSSFYFGSRRKNSGPSVDSQNSFRVGVLFLLALLFHAVLLAMLFELSVSWNFSNRYALTVLPLVAISLALAMASAWPQCGSPLKGAALLLLVLPFCQISFYPFFNSQRVAYDDWKALYAYLKIDSKPQSRAYILPYNEPGRWEAEDFGANAFYDHGQVILPQPLPSWQLMYGPRNLVEDIKSGVKPPVIYLIFNRNGNESRQNWGRVRWQHGEEVFPLANFWVLKIAGIEEPWTSLRQAFAALETVASPDIYHLKFYATVAGLDLLRGQCEKARASLDLVRTLSAQIPEEADYRAAQELGQTFAKVCEAHSASGTQPLKDAGD